MPPLPGFVFLFFKAYPVQFPLSFIFQPPFANSSLATEGTSYTPSSSMLGFCLTSHCNKKPPFPKAANLIEAFHINTYIKNRILFSEGCIYIEKEKLINSNEDFYSWKHLKRRGSDWKWKIKFRKTASWFCWQSLRFSVSLPSGHSILQTNYLFFTFSS